MSAYLAALDEKPGYERRSPGLDGFEEKYPKLASQRPQVVKLRLWRYSRLGNLEAAGHGMRRARRWPGLGSDLSRRVGSRFLTRPRAQHRRPAKRRPAAAAKRAPCS